MTTRLHIFLESDLFSFQWQPLALMAAYRVFLQLHSSIITMIYICYDYLSVLMLLFIFLTLSFSYVMSCMSIYYTYIFIICFFYKYIPLVSYQGHPLHVEMSFYFCRQYRNSTKMSHRTNSPFLP